MRGSPSLQGNKPYKNTPAATKVEGQIGVLARGHAQAGQGWELRQRQGREQERQRQRVQWAGQWEVVQGQKMQLGLASVESGQAQARRGRLRQALCPSRKSANGQHNHPSHEARPRAVFPNALQTITGALDSGTEKSLGDGVLGAHGRGVITSNNCHGGTQAHKDTSICAGQWSSSRCAHLLGKRCTGVAVL